MTPHAVRPRPVRIGDGANIAFLRVVVVRPRHAQATTTDTVEACGVPPEALRTRPRGTLHRFILAGQAPGAPRIRLPQRILSP